MKLSLPWTDLTRTPAFHNAVKLSFKKVDKDKSGSIDPHELTLALSYFYFKISQKVPGVGEPPSREELDSWFEKHDLNKSGDMDLGEYEEFCRSWIKQKGMNLTGAIITALAVQAIAIPELVNLAKERSVGSIFEKIPKQLMMVGAVLVSKLFFKGIHFGGGSSVEDLEEAAA
mmetsp:Transcript_403/g.793  ORF Transcript_403/g.793 Transcript_403/m.793 type:complete len:173 (-) Transcript_403:161-679(-)